VNTPIQRIQRGRVTWLAAGEEGRALVTASEPDLAALNEREAQPVKTSLVRTVWRLPGYYVKEYRARRVGDRLAGLIRGSRAMAEWRAARRLIALGVPTFQPIAVGEEHRWGVVVRSLLVMREIEDATSLGDVVTSGRIEPGQRRALIAAFAALVRRLHEGGVEHLDPHTGNFLVTGVETSRPVVHLIDLHPVRLRSAGARPHRRSLCAPRDVSQGGVASTGKPTPARGALSRRARRRCLGRLWAAFHLATSRQDRLRFLRAYASGKGVRYLLPERPTGRFAQKVPDTFSLSVVTRGRREAHRLWRRRDRRCRRPGKYFFRIRTWRVKALAVAELDRPDHRRWLCEPEALMTCGDVEVVKTEAGAAIVRTDLKDRTGARCIYVKRIPVRTWRGCLRRSPAMRAWRRGHGMLNRALPTARPLAVVNRRWGPFLRRSYLVTEAVPHAVSLYDLLSRPTLTGAQASVLAAALGRLVAGMHEVGFSHGDLKLVNILARLEGGRRHDQQCATAGQDRPCHLALWLIDLDGARRHRGPVRRRRRVRDLARLLVAIRRFDRGHPGVVGRDECRAFLDAYLGPWVRAEDRTAWCERVQRRARRLATERRKRRDGSRGRLPHTEPPT